MRKRKAKYWYREEYTECVLCGKTMQKYRFRVYQKEKAGIFRSEGACGNHFF